MTDPDALATPEPTFCQQLANSIAVETDEAKRETLRQQYREHCATRADDA